MTNKIAGGITIKVSEPTHPLATQITKDDVFGRWTEDHIPVHRGMVVSRYGDKCPIFDDIVPYKSVTVVFDARLESEVYYWLEYVHGANCVTHTHTLDDGRIALRSDYQCW